MVVFNIFFAFVTLPDLIPVLREASFEMLAIPAIFGIFWGIGVTLFGVGMADVGLSLGYAIIMGGVIDPKNGFKWAFVNESGQTSFLLRALRPLSSWGTVRVGRHCIPNIHCPISTRIRFQPSAGSP